ncbi:nuclear transport factor 2 family protein [Pseudanabaena sp. FACHB-2040]|uniref:nuclear transport factor 2 family protein n=1 Tax=Pseudanabaena sp. FACHB-2040 TaxID=2692859 RepID=UPI0016824FC2|nr:nuclear transport factor 2 family protein [Pseudanabaena sp. FACHB-2040]MBD2258510.1 nuclear transport factor 2 family protein [Pseudanabaena sp. FACHB-2040]
MIPFSTTFEDVLESAQRAWLMSDAEGFAGLFDEIGEFMVPGGRWIGQEDIQLAFQEYSDAYEVLQIEVLQILKEGNRAAVEWRWTDRERATGNTSEAEDAIFIEMLGGRITRWREYIDNGSL